VLLVDIMVCMLLLLVGFPCVYTTVKCGSSGHNIRVATDMDSAAVGMVVTGNQLTATRQVSRLVLTSELRFGMVCSMKYSQNCFLSGRSSIV